MHKYSPNDATPDMFPKVNHVPADLSVIFSMNVNFFFLSTSPWMSTFLCVYSFKVLWFSWMSCSQMSAAALVSPPLGVIICTYHWHWHLQQGLSAGVLCSKPSRGHGRPFYNSKNQRQQFSLRVVNNSRKCKRKKLLKILKFVCYVWETHDHPKVRLVMMNEGFDLLEIFFNYYKPPRYIK